MTATPVARRATRQRFYKGRVFHPPFLRATHRRDASILQGYRKKRSRKAKVVSYVPGVRHFARPRRPHCSPYVRFFEKKKNSKFLSFFPYLARLVDRSLGISLERVALSENPQTDWFAGNVEKPSLRERRSNVNTLGSIEEERKKEERDREIDR